ncbi:MAG: MnhB domain-containing protein [Phycisphaeraceae bacterium]
MSSPILRTVMRLIVPLTLLFAGYMAIKGHNEPGGGFIGGLVAAIVLVLYFLTFGAEALARMIPLHPRVLLFVGLALALGTAIFPMFLGLPLLTTYVNHHVPLVGGAEVEFASALIFDIGVFLVVVGVSVGIITRISQEVGR